MTQAIKNDLVLNWPKYVIQLVISVFLAGSILGVAQWRIDTNAELIRENKAQLAAKANCSDVEQSLSTKTDQKEFNGAVSTLLAEIKGVDGKLDMLLKLQGGK